MSEAIPTDAERRSFGELAGDVAYLRRGCGLLVAPFKGSFRIGSDVVDESAVRARAQQERERRAPAPKAIARPCSPAPTVPVVTEAAAPEPPRLTGAAQISKARAEKASEDLGPTPSIEWIALADLGIDRRYQREMGKGNWAHANRILREWNWLHYQPLVVAPADGGGYVVIDGQHRLEAAKKHPLIDRLPCYVVEAPDIAQQAGAFVALNARRIGVTRLQRFWAAHAAGDPTALQVHEACDRAGVAITRSGGVLPPKTTFATFTIEKLLPHGSAAITTALATLAEAHPETRDAFKASIIVALVTIVAAAGETFDRPRYVDVLRGEDLDNLIDRARQKRLVEGGSQERAVEALLRFAYVARKPRH